MTPIKKETIRVLCEAYKLPLPELDEATRQTNQDVIAYHAGKDAGADYLARKILKVLEQ